MKNEEIKCNELYCFEGDNEEFLIEFFGKIQDKLFKLVIAFELNSHENYWHFFWEDDKGNTGVNNGKFPKGMLKALKKYIERDEYA